MCTGCASRLHMLHKFVWLCAPVCTNDFMYFARLRVTYWNLYLNNFGTALDIERSTKAMGSLLTATSQALFVLYRASGAATQNFDTDLKVAAPKIYIPSLVLLDRSLLLANWRPGPATPRPPMFFVGCYHLPFSFPSCRPPVIFSACFVAQRESGEKVDCASACLNSAKSLKAVVCWAFLPLFQGVTESQKMSNATCSTRKDW